MRHAGCLTRRQMTSVVWQDVEEADLRVGQTFLSAAIIDRSGHASVYVPPLSGARTSLSSNFTQPTSYRNEGPLLPSHQETVPEMTPQIPHISAVEGRDALAPSIVEVVRRGCDYGRVATVLPPALKIDRAPPPSLVTARLATLCSPIL